METKFEEDPISKSIDRHTCKKTTNKYFCAALFCMGLSMCLKCMKKEHQALFVGQWVSPMLLLGMYKKMAKIKEEKEMMIK